MPLHMLHVLHVRAAISEDCLQAPQMASHIIVLDPAQPSEGPPNTALPSAPSSRCVRACVRVRACLRHVCVLVHLRVSVCLCVYMCTHAQV